MGHHYHPHDDDDDDDDDDQGDEKVGGAAEVNGWRGKGFFCSEQFTGFRHT